MKPVNQAQSDFLFCEDSRVLFSGAFGAGKTWALNAKALLQSLKYPNNFGVICRKVRATMAHTTIRSFFQDTCPPEAITAYNRTEGMVTLSNGSQIVFMGLDDPLKLGSLELGFAGIDEVVETGEDDWRSLEGRLRLPNVPHQIFGACNPGSPEHYLYKMFYEERKGKVFNANTTDNPCLPEDYKARLNEFSGPFYDRYVLGKWTAMEGLVYPDFTMKHLIEPFVIPDSWPRYAGIDWGFNNPTAAIWVAVSPDAVHYVYREYYVKEALLEQHARAIMEHSKGESVYAFDADPAGKQNIEEVKSYGLHCRAADNAVYAGINKVGALFKDNRLFIFRGLPNVLKELQNYVWLEKKGTPQDTPKKEGDHLMDSLRYAIMAEGVEVKIGWL